jgi:probable HAF family extracellular repeat protein
MLASFLAIAFSVALSAVPARARLNSIDFPNAFETDCNAINDRGDGNMVGFFIDKKGVTHGFAIQLAYQIYGVIDVPGATATLLYGVNNAQLAVGWYVDGTGVTHGVEVECCTAVVAVLDPPGSTLTNAWSINDLGEVVGAYTDSSGVYHGFTYVKGAYTTYDAPGAILTEITGINNKGDMVGIFDDSSGVEHGFGIKNGHFIQIDDPQANGGVTATDRVNNNQEYVGLWGTDTSGPFSGYHARNGVFTTVTFPGAFETRVRGLNNGGTIVGRYTDQNGVVHGFAGGP